MAYKRNPMRSERIGALAKFVMSLSTSSAMVASTQWFERTLDDSANKRLTIPQSFLAIDAILLIWNNIMNGIVVYENRIQKHIMDVLAIKVLEGNFVTGDTIVIDHTDEGQYTFTKRS